MVNYIRVSGGEVLPNITHRKPFRCVVLVEQDVSNEWQYKTSKWLVDSGCLYMMAWGLECSSWDDSVDNANLQNYNYKDIPDDNFVMTTWHEDEEVKEVFWFAKHCAFHSDIKLENNLILHISDIEREIELTDLFESP